MPTSDFIIVGARRWIPADAENPGEWYSEGLRVIKLSNIVSVRGWNDGSTILLMGKEANHELSVYQSAEEVFCKIREAEGFGAENGNGPRKPLVAESLDEYFVQKFEDIATDRFPRTTSEDDAATKEEA